MRGRPCKKKLIKITAIFGDKTYTFDTSSKTKLNESMHKYKENENIIDEGMKENQNLQNLFFESSIELKQKEQINLNVQSKLSRLYDKNEKAETAFSSISNKVFDDFSFIQMLNNDNIIIESDNLSNDSVNIEDINLEVNGLLFID